MITLKEFLHKTKGKFFTVQFTKKDGTNRVLNGRLGVTKHLMGGEKKNHNPDHMVVFDVQNNGYRTINLETVHEIKVDGTKYKVVEGELFKKVVA